MHCKKCGFANSEDDHRCLRCGRRLSGTVVAAPPGYSGANALAPALLTNNDTLNDTTAEFLAARRGVLAQPTLFASQNPPNVIPFSRPKVEQAAPAPAA